MSWITTQNSRLYVDRIFGASSKFANWEPARQIKIGDYGRIDKNSGEFIKKGNIFEHPLTKEYAAEKLREKRGATDDLQKFLSLRVFDVNLDAAVDLSEFPAVASFAVKEKFKFTRGRAAVLVMHKPTPVTLEGEIKGLPNRYLRGRHLVTEVMECRAYFMFLSSGKSGVVTLALDASSPLIAPAGGEVSVGWFVKGADGVIKRGSSQSQDDTQSQTITPLFSGYKYRRWRAGYRDEIPDEEGKGCYTPSLPPWGTLDDDGEDESDEEEDDSSTDDEGPASIPPKDGRDDPIPPAST